MDSTQHASARTLRWGRSAYTHPGHFWGTGNRCGHDPAKGEFERYQAPETKRELPSVMKKLLEGARDYYKNPGMLPTLSNLNGKANQDGNPRCNRSEARAAESLVLSAIITHTDFASLRVGTPTQDGGFIHRSCGELAKVAGLHDPKHSTDEHPEPSQRFWRAFSRLKIAGAFTVHQQYETLPDGSKRARPAIKAVSFQFLVALGKVGYEALKKFRTWCSNRLKKTRAKHREQFPEQHDAAQARHRLMTKQAKQTGIKTQLPKVRRGPRDIPDANDEKEQQRHYNRMVNDYFAQVASNNPGASATEVRALVRKKYPPYDVWRDSQ